MKYAIAYKPDNKWRFATGISGGACYNLNACLGNKYIKTSHLLHMRVVLKEYRSFCPPPFTISKLFDEVYIKI